MTVTYPSPAPAVATLARRRRLLLASVLCVSLLAPAAVLRAQEAPPLTVFAAASLQDALRAVEPA